MSIDKLIEKISELKNPTAAGLDPRLGYLPPALLDKHLSAQGETPEAAAAAFLEFNKGLMDALCGLVPAVKLQSACYEMLGPAGMQAMRDSMLYARTLGFYVIADAKRGDIGSTSEAYSAAFLGVTKIGGTEFRAFPADAVTVNPYLGSDNLNEFIKDIDAHDKAVFVLCRTSNKSSGEVQELPVGDRPLYQTVAEQIDRAGAKHKGSLGFSKIGAVTGATHPSQLKELRRRYPSMFFLVPGYGAQGARAADAAGAFNDFGRGAVINNSRGLMCAWMKKKTEDYAGAARQAAAAMRDELRAAAMIV